MTEFDADYAFDVVTRRLPEAGIDALLIGGHAVNHYGVARATQDIDFMIAAADESKVRQIMSASGFTNIAAHDPVIFFSRPGSPLRVDFLKTDRTTMDLLLAHAVPVTYFGSFAVKVPRLKDLVAMKLFALRSGDPRREDKDFPDIVHLVLEHAWDLEADLKPLCETFGTETLYRRLRTRILELKHA